MQKTDVKAEQELITQKFVLNAVFLPVFFFFKWRGSQGCKSDTLLAGYHLVSLQNNTPMCHILPAGVRDTRCPWRSANPVSGSASVHGIFNMEPVSESHVQARTHYSYLFAHNTDTHNCILCRVKIISADIFSPRSHHTCYKCSWHCCEQLARRARAQTHMQTLPRPLSVACGKHRPNQIPQSSPLREFLVLGVRTCLALCLKS